MVCVLIQVAIGVCFRLCHRPGLDILGKAPSGPATLVMLTRYSAMREHSTQVVASCVVVCVSEFWQIGEVVNWQGNDELALT